MQAIADAAGVSRGMPGYAFGSKERLYEAVLERAFDQPRQAVAGDAPVTAGEPAAALTAWIGRYLRFLAEHPTYVRLLQRAALDGGERVAASPANSAALAEALAAVERLGDPAAPGAEQARRVLVSAMALCFFPFEHRATLLAPLGIDVDAPEFVATWTAHVVELLTVG